MHRGRFFTEHFGVQQRTRIEGGVFQCFLDLRFVTIGSRVPLDAPDWSWRQRLAAEGLELFDRTASVEPQTQRLVCTVPPRRVVENSGAISKIGP